MDIFITRILDELYELDPGLRQHERELKELLVKLIQARPVAELSESYKRDLQAQLLQVFKEQHAASRYSKQFIYNFNFMKQFKLAAGVVVVVAIVIAGATYYWQNMFKYPRQEISFEPGTTIVSLDGHAFGELALSVNEEVFTNEAQGLGGGGAKTTSAIRPQSGGGGGMASVAADRMMEYPSYVYDYKYIGDDLPEVEGENASVYKRVVGQFAGNGNFGQFLSANLGLIDLSKFADKSLQNFSMVEDKINGYVVWVDMINDQASIYKNYETWDDPFADCRDEKCYERLRLTESGLPTDGQLIEISNSFLANRGINLNSYGEPFVNNIWRTYPDVSSEQLYIPDEIPVVYPQFIDGQIVYDESGNQTGLNVNVNIRDKSVSSIYNLTSQNYQSSLYDIETDSERLISIAEQGNWRYKPYVDENATKVTVELGTPDRVLLNVYLYSRGESDQLFVPALSFPVVNVMGNQWVDDQYLKNSHVVVPLVKELLDQVESEYPPMPVLLTEPAVGKEVIEE